ncbi:MAG: hypothetical protein AAFW98_07735, partial [Pseudomonadota bacterium]
ARWVWDLAAIKAAGITDNLVDLLLTKLRRLPEPTQEALQIAACVGNRFDIDTLALVQKTTPHAAYESLNEAAEEGLVTPVSAPVATEGDDLDAPILVREFTFLHDRVMEAAHGLFDSERQQDVHLAIGRRLRATLSAEALSERIFDVVEHLNVGRPLITDPAERLALAELNLEAAEKSSDSTAYSVALDFVRVAQDLLGEDGWGDHYDTMIAASRQRAELEYLNGNFDGCSEFVAITLEHARTDFEKAEVYFTRIAQHTLLAEFQQAEEAGYNALALIGVHLPRENLDAAGQEAVGTVTQMLAGKDPASLIKAPDATSREIALAQRTLRHLTITAFLSNQALWPLLVGTSVRLSLEHGNTPESALSYANYGLILGAFMSRYKDGQDFGELALRLCDRYGGRAPEATVRLVVGVELIPWVAHAREALPVIDRGYQDGLNAGDILWAGYLVMYRLLHDTFIGKRLDELLDGSVDQLEFAENTQNKGAAAGIRAHQIVLSTLAGRTKSSSVFAFEDVDERSFLEVCEQNKMAMAICFYKILKAQALYLFGRPREALAATRDVEEMLSFIVNHVTLADHLLYQSLSLAALHGGGLGEEQDAALEEIMANLRQLTIWSDACPDNFLAKRLMVEAELARISGEDNEATELYDRAIDAATEAHILQDEALANELAARFVLERRPGARVGGMYLRDACYAYSLWGADRKVEELKLEFPQLIAIDRDLGGMAQRSATVTSTIHSTGSTDAGGGMLDLD